MSTLKWLENWYFQQCDGDWEHGYGVKIDTLDNPGWSVKINLEGTELEDKSFNTLELEKTEEDWIHCRIKEGWFEGFGGAFNLEDILSVFKDWTTT